MLDAARPNSVRRSVIQANDGWLAPWARSTVKQANVPFLVGHELVRESLQQASDGGGGEYEVGELGVTDGFGGTAASVGLRPLDHPAPTRHSSLHLCVTASSWLSTSAPRWAGLGRTETVS